MLGVAKERAGNDFPISHGCWGRLFPPRDKSRQPLPVSNEWVQWRLKDAKWVATARERLQSLSWFMKCLKEPLARLANRHDKVRGAFFEERFKSIGILDEESLLATCAYIDLNPVAAGIAETPEASPHTSVSTRVEHVKAQGRTEDLQAAAKGSAAPPQASAGLEDSIWLCPIEDRSRLDSARRGMLEGFSLGSYLLLVDYTGRLFREGKAAISAELAGILRTTRAAAPIAGEPGSRNSRPAACSAASSRPPAHACEKSPQRSACTTWRIWMDASRADATWCSAPTLPYAPLGTRNRRLNPSSSRRTRKISAACALCRPRPAR